MSVSEGHNEDLPLWSLCRLPSLLRKDHPIGRHGSTTSTQVRRLPNKDTQAETAASTTVLSPQTARPVHHHGTPRAAAPLPVHSPIGPFCYAVPSTVNSCYPRVPQADGHEAHATPTHLPGAEARRPEKAPGDRVVISVRQRRGTVRRSGTDGQYVPTTAIEERRRTRRRFWSMRRVRSRRRCRRFSVGVQF